MVQRRKEKKGNLKCGKFGASGSSPPSLFSLLLFSCGLYIRNSGRFPLTLIISFFSREKTFKYRLFSPYFSRIAHSLPGATLRCPPKKRTLFKNTWELRFWKWDVPTPTFPHQRSHYEKNPGQYFFLPAGPFHQNRGQFFYRDDSFEFDRKKSFFFSFFIACACRYPWYFFLRVIILYVGFRASSPFP